MRLSPLALTGLFMIGAGTASAAPVAIGLVDFSGSAVVIDFNAIPDTAAINSQFSSSGVAFGGALVGLTNPGDTHLFNGSTIASNWIYRPGAGHQGATWSATFETTQNIVGFEVETQADDPVTIEAFSGATSLGSVTFPNPNGLTVDFIGIRDFAGFDRISVTTAANYNGFFAMDNFRFEQQGNSVPVPGTLVLAGLGMMGLGLSARRAKR
ncbi:MAG: hypothetical protein ABS84_13635 [Rubrivivax sp. SCN 71-131]|jgi:hypothetical protein|nr:MAG: hypothetical protein ABS84_13635 [Rubrivivax sp. SCN 71-131]